MESNFTKVLAGLALLVSVGSVNARAGDGGVVIGSTNGRNADLAPVALQTELKMGVEYQYGIHAFLMIDEEQLPMSDGGEGATIRYKFYQGSYVVQFDVSSKVVDGVWNFTVVRTDEADGVVSTGSPLEFTLVPGQSTQVLLKKWVNYMQQNFRITFSL